MLRHLRIGFGGRYLGPRGTSKQRHRRRLHNEELHDLYCIPNVTLLVNVEERVYRGIRHLWGRGQVQYTTFVGKPSRGHIKDIFANGNLILK